MQKTKVDLNEKIQKFDFKSKQAISIEQSYKNN